MPPCSGVARIAAVQDARLLRRCHQPPNAALICERGGRVRAKPALRLARHRGEGDGGDDDVAPPDVILTVLALLDGGCPSGRTWER